MRYLALSVLLVSLTAQVASAQALTDFAAVTAGGAVGGASGKAVGKGVSGIFGKVNAATATAAASDKNAKTAQPVLVAAPGVPKSTGTATALSQAATATQPKRPAKTAVNNAPLAALPQQLETPLAEVTPALPPPPSMTADALKAVTQGMPRADVLKLGQPSSRITMFDEGHLVEVYSYREKGERFGLVKLSDGAVSSVQAQ